MLRLDIPGYGKRSLEHLVLDFNGTLAEDGRLLEGVRERLMRLSSDLALHVVTADTFGHAREALEGIPCDFRLLSGTGQSQAKRDLVDELGAEATACIGNGRNDRLMLAAAGLGIAVVQKEGASAEAIAAADVVARDVRDALDLLAQPRRLLATLRD
jgi:soluble P-type ATPase